jgi:hypothetical protein
MTSRKFPIRIDKRTFLAQEQEGKEWLYALSVAHLRDITSCLCNSHNPVRLVVRMYGRDTPNAHYGLAKLSGTGLDHDSACHYFGEDSELSKYAISLPAFDELEDGAIRAHLAMPLKLNESEVRSKEASNQKKTNAKSRARVSDITLLQKLWRTAGLNVFRGTPRSWFAASYSIINTAKKIIVSKRGDTLADYLLVGSNHADRLATKHNNEVLDRAAKEPTRLFVIGRARSFNRDKTQILLPLQESQSLPKILVQLKQLDEFLAGRNFYKNLINNKTGNVIFFAYLEPKNKDWWHTLALNGIATTTNMLPVESSYEVEFEQYLVAQGRKFIKPMVVDESGEGDKRPDFILLDTKPKARCEVWGMQTEAYLADKAKRIAEYATKGQMLISWSANPRETFPILPSPFKS